MSTEYITRGEHEEYVKRMADEHTRINRRLEGFEKQFLQMQEMSTNVGKLAVNMEHMLEEQREQGSRLTRLEEAPNQAWATIKHGLFNAVGAAIGGAIIAAIIFFI